MDSSATNLRRSRPLVVALFGLVFGITVAFFTMLISARRPVSAPGDFLPNQTVPSLAGLNPANAERDLRRFHTALVKFRKLKGRLPKSPWELRDAGKAGLVDLNDDDFRNPDAVRSPSAPMDVRGKDPETVELNVAYGFTFPHDPNSTVWMGCSLYEREGIESDSQGRGRTVLEGFTMRLYADGRITREPVAERKWVRENLNSFRLLRHGESPKGKQILTARQMHAEFLERARLDGERTREKAGG